MAESVAVQAVDFINSIGIMDVIIRFVLGFGVTYGALEKTQVFGPKQQTLHTIMGLAVGLLFAISI